MFRVELMPARRGDALWIEYGRPEAPHRVLIDGGLSRTADHLRRRIDEVPRDCEGKRRFDLLIVTHIDLDHIAGVLDLLRDPPPDVVFDDVWFNGWKHLAPAGGEGPSGVLGPKQGEALTYWLEEGAYVWNGAFGGGPVAIPTGGGPLPTRTLPGSMKLTLLSPMMGRLGQLREVWEEVITAEGFEPGRAGAELEGVGHPEDEEEPPGGSGLLGDDEAPPNIQTLAEKVFEEDSSPANGSSIAVLAEYEGRSCVFAGDAYASDLAWALGSLAASEREGRLPVDALKLSHHGGRKNTSVDLLRQIRCRRFLFSTDGSIYRHPHPETVARILMHSGAERPELCFNYRSSETAVWDDRALFDGAYPYDPVYPSGGEGICVDVSQG